MIFFPSRHPATVYFMCDAFVSDGNERDVMKEEYNKKNAQFSVWNRFFSVLTIIIINKIIIIVMKENIFLSSSREVWMRPFDTM